MERVSIEFNAQSETSGHFWDGITVKRLRDDDDNQQ